MFVYIYIYISMYVYGHLCVYAYDSCFIQLWLKFIYNFFPFIWSRLKGMSLYDFILWRGVLPRDVEKLWQLILAEEFLNSVPEEIRIHLSERKTDLSYEMAALADEYTLTHRKTKERIYTGSQGSRMKIKAELSPEEKPKEENRRTFQRDSRTAICYKCGKAGYIAIRWQLGKGPETNWTQVGKRQGAAMTARANQSYQPWMKRGIIRGPNGGPVEVSILRDTGASQSLLLQDKVPKGVIEAACETVQIEGIGGKRMKIPLCEITLKSKWKDGPIQVRVVDKLPMKGISLILGNEVKIKKDQLSNMAKMNAENEENKMVKMNAKNEEDKMVAEPQARYSQCSHLQRGRWKGRKWSFHISGNRKTNWSVIREEMKVRRTMAINSLTLI